MKDALAFAVLPGGGECHAAKETPHGRRGGGNVVTLSTLCGAGVEDVSCADARALPAARLYRERPAGLALCKVCSRLMEKRSGWARLLSHIFRNRRGFRSGVRSLGRQL